MLLLMFLKGSHVIITRFCLCCVFFWFSFGEDVAVVYFPQEGLYANATSAKDNFAVDLTAC